jgi:hypothetical protein
LVVLLFLNVRVPTSELFILICDDGLSGRLKEWQYGDLDAIFILVVRP